MHSSPPPMPEHIFEACAFMQRYRDDFQQLAQPDWWVGTHILMAFGRAGREAIHQLCGRHPEYCEQEVDQSIENCEQYYQNRHPSPHSCREIQTSLNFACPADCKSKNIKAKSPVELAKRLTRHNRREGRYLLSGANGKLQVDIKALLSDILKDFCFETLRDTEEVLVYSDGVYRMHGESLIKEEIERRVEEPALATSHLIKEIVNHVRRNTYVDREKFNPAIDMLSLINGRYDLISRTLKPHTPQFLSTIRIPVAYDPDADCPRIKKFLTEVLLPQDIPLIEEMVGYCLTFDYRFQRAFLLLGEGANGKTTLTELIRAFLGPSNCSSVSLQNLSQPKSFQTAELYDKLANLFADLPTKPLQYTSSFKTLTGGDTILVERKYAHPFSFSNHAKLIFSANQPPRIDGEDSHAFWRRWIIINFPNQFSGEEADQDLLTKLTTKDEMSGLFNLALQGLKRLLDNQRFSYDRTVDEVAEQYQQAADPVYAFLKDCCEAESEAWEAKEALYQAFRQYCKENRLPTLQSNAFGREILKQEEIKVTSCRPTASDGSRPMAWKGIRLISVTDVRDVKDSSLFCSVVKTEHQEEDKYEIGIGKNLDNLGSHDGVDTEPRPDKGRCDHCVGEAGSSHSSKAAWEKVI